MFHVSDGLYFERVAHDQGHGIGAVRIVKKRDAKLDSPIIFEQIIDADAWASVVSTVSSLGETATTWALFKILQQGGFVDDSLLKTAQNDVKECP